MSSLQKGLVGHWTMNSEDTDNGKIRDRSAYDNHGTLNGSPKTGRPSPVGDSYDFNGSYVEVPISIDQDNTGQDYTVSAWFNSNDITQNRQGIIGQDNGGYDFFIQLSRNSNGELMVATGSDTQIKPAGTISSNEWNNIVVELRGSDILYSLNGEPLQDTGVNRSNYGSGQESVLAIGSISFDSGEDFNGQISDVRVYNRALSQSEIMQLYNQRTTRAHKMQRVPVAQQDLVAYYPFASSGATDQSGNGYDGTTNSGTYRSTGGHNGNGDYNLQEDYISAPVPSSVQGGGSKSLVGWSYHNSIDNDNHFYNFGTASGDQAFGWYVPSGNLKIYHFGNDSNTGYNVPTGEWVHLVLTYDGSSTSKAYVNGSLQHTYNSGSLNTGNTRLAIGGREDGVRTVPDANFSDIRIYDKELSKHEVKRLYQSEGNIFGGGIKSTSYQGNQVIIEEDEYGTWLLVQNYEHYGGENPTISRASNFPSMPNRIGNRKLRISDIQSIGTSAEMKHVDNISQYGITDVSAVRLEAETSNHNRKINYFTENQTVIDSIVDDNTKAGHSELKDQIIKYDDHTAFLPNNMSGDNDNQTDNRTDRIFGYGFPMFGDGSDGTRVHWAVAGFGSRWEVDDFPDNASNTTIHRVWVRI